MTTIANAFLDDFEEEEISIADANSFKAPPLFSDVKVETIDMDKDSDEETHAEIISDLLEDPKLRKILATVAELVHTPPRSLKALRIKFRERLPATAGSQANHGNEYAVLDDSNKMARKLEVEIYTVHKHLCDIYSARFPELEQTVSHPVKYAQVVRKIGNDIDEVSSALDRVVSDHQKLSTSISASATTGKPLPESDLRKVNEACDLIIGLDIARNRLLEYIKSRMLFLAPNLSAMVGPDIAAQLITLAGGLKQLCNMPSCNIQTMGSEKRNENSGYTIFAKNPNEGVVSKSSVILDCPDEFRAKALRLLCSKLVLAARVDCHQPTPSDELGNEYLNSITKRIEKWQEPEEAKPEKPLALPKEKRNSKRGGKRYRKMREQYKVTELQRMKNRVGFNVGETRDEHGEGFGMIGKSGVGGVVKVVSKDTVKVRKLERINKLMVDRERKKKQRKLGFGAQSGLATSVVMTEVQGMSFVNPEAQSTSKTGSDGVSTYFGSKSFNKVKL